jgi:hypothetical protein
MLIVVMMSRIHDWWMAVGAERLSSQSLGWALLSLPRVSMSRSGMAVSVQ